jgi:serine/threonine protein kinase
MTSLVEKSSTTEYKLINILGTGTFGTVWKAIDTSNNKYVAIKFFKIAIDEFNYELNGLNRLKDICTNYSVCILDHYILNNRPRIVMNYIKGSTLLDIIHDIDLNNRLKSTNIIYDLLIGIAYIRTFIISHQDIKEANIIYDIETNTYKYIDFGLNCIGNNCNNIYCKHPCGIIGTLYTVSPEIYRLKQEPSFFHTMSHDLWSIGVVIYDYYSMTNKNDIIKYYDTNGSLNELTALCFKSTNELVQLIDNLNTKSYWVKNILKLLLEIDYIKRLKNWVTLFDYLEPYYSINKELIDSTSYDYLNEIIYINHLDKIEEYKRYYLLNRLFDKYIFDNKIFIKIMYTSKIGDYGLLYNDNMFKLSTKYSTIPYSNSVTYYRLDKVVEPAQKYGKNKINIYSLINL